MSRGATILAWFYASGIWLYAFFFVLTNWHQDISFGLLIWWGFMKGLIWPWWILAAFAASPL